MEGLQESSFRGSLSYSAGAWGRSKGWEPWTQQLHPRTSAVNRRKQSIWEKAVKEGGTSSSVLYLMLCFSLLNVLYALNIGFKHVPSASLSFLVHMETAGAITPSDTTYNRNPYADTWRLSILSSSIVFLLGKYRKYSNVCLGECLTFFPFPLDSYLCLLAFPFVRAIALALKKKK